MIGSTAIFARAFLRICGVATPLAMRSSRKPRTNWPDLYPVIDQHPIDKCSAQMARKLPRYPTVPAVLIGWLGRDLAFRGQDIGAMLLYDAIARTATSPAGVHAICADAIDEAAAAFYLRHLFTPIAGKPLSLFIPLATALELIRGE